MTSLVHTLIVSPINKIRLNFNSNNNMKESSFFSHSQSRRENDGFQPISRAALDKGYDCHESDDS